MILQSSISNHYASWRKTAIALCSGNTFEADDLLHDTLLSIMDNSSVIEYPLTYVNNALKMAHFSNRSSYHNTFRKFMERTEELKDKHFNTTESVWLGDKITSEQLDIYISRLPFLEREVFYLYALNDFSYNELSNATGIPKSALYNAVKSAVNELRKSIVKQ